MKPFLTLLLDSYRGLKSETIFWVTVGLSLLVAIIFLSIGFDDKGMSFFFGAKTWENEFMVKGGPLSHLTYVMLFTNFVAGGWLTFIAIILALISCASIFPDAMKEGSAGMLMTKVPSRLQVFLAKLTGSLFFVLIQVGLFVVIVFLAFRWRLGVWNFSLFWYVPAVLLVFLNLYSFMVLIGVKTRSVMTSIMLTMLLWGISAGINWGVGFVGMFYQESRYEYVEEKPVSVEEPMAEEGSATPPETPTEVEEEPGEDTDGPTMVRREREGDQNLKGWMDTLKFVHSFFPKNAPIMAAAEKKLVMEGIVGFQKSGDLQKLGKDAEEEFEEAMEEISGEDSFFYSIGTSCIFAFIMLSWAGWTFCRKDL